MALLPQFLNFVFSDFKKYQGLFSSFKSLVIAGFSLNPFTSSLLTKAQALSAYID